MIRMQLFHRGNRCPYCHVLNRQRAWIRLAGTFLYLLVLQFDHNVFVCVCVCGTFFFNVFLNILMILFKVIDGGGIGHFSVKRKQNQTQTMQIALFVGIK